MNMIIKRNILVLECTLRMRPLYSQYDMKLDNMQMSKVKGKIYVL